MSNGADEDAGSCKISTPHPVKYYTRAQYLDAWIKSQEGQRWLFNRPIDKFYER